LQKLYSLKFEQALQLERSKMKKSTGYFKTFSLTLSVGLAMSTSLPAIASIKDTSVSIGSPNRSEIVLGQRRSRLGFKVRGIRPSMSREGGISRSPDATASCAGGPITVTSLLPKTNVAQLAAAEKAEIEIEKTVAERPTFFIHVSQTSAQEAEFILKKKIGEDKDGRPVYDEDKYVDQTVALPKNPGIVSISLPAEAANLEVGQSYYWTFQVICEPTDRNKDVTVDGAVQRIELDSSLANKLQQAEPRDLPEIYAEAEIWTDALSTLADLRKANPNDQQLQDDWNDLLNSVGLDKVAQATIIDSLNRIN
jgi:hypothetical protein